VSIESQPVPSRGEFDHLLKFYVRRLRVPTLCMISMHAVRVQEVPEY
jgi:hypothetical protein